MDDKKKAPLPDAAKKAADAEKQINPPKYEIRIDRADEEEYRPALLKLNDGVLMRGIPEFLAPSVIIPEDIRNNPDIKTAVIVSVAEDIKRDALEKGMEGKYKNTPDMTVEALEKSGPDRILRIGERMVVADKEDISIMQKAREAASQASAQARRIIAKEAGIIGTGIDEKGVNDIKIALEMEAKQQMQGRKAPASEPPLAPAKGFKRAG